MGPFPAMGSLGMIIRRSEGPALGGGVSCPGSGGRTNLCFLIGDPEGQTWERERVLGQGCKGLPLRLGLTADWVG